MRHVIYVELVVEGVVRAETFFLLLCDNVLN